MWYQQDQVVVLLETVLGTGEHTIIKYMEKKNKFFSSQFPLNKQKRYVFMQDFEKCFDPEGE